MRFNVRVSFLALALVCICVPAFAGAKGAPKRIAPNGTDWNKKKEADQVFNYHPSENGVGSVKHVGGLHGWTAGGVEFQQLKFYEGKDGTGALSATNRIATTRYDNGSYRKQTTRTSADGEQRKLTITGWKLKNHVLVSHTIERGAAGQPLGWKREFYGRKDVLEPGRTISGTYAR